MSLISIIHTMTARRRGGAASIAATCPSTPGAALVLSASA
jgi:hypothetical protein